MTTAIGIVLLGAGAFSLGVWSVFAYLSLFSTAWDRNEQDRGDAA